MTVQAAATARAAAEARTAVTAQTAVTTRQRWCSDGKRTSSCMNEWVLAELLHIILEIDKQAQ